MFPWCSSLEAFTPWISVPHPWMRQTSNGHSYSPASCALWRPPTKVFRHPFLDLFSFFSFHHFFHFSPESHIQMSCSWFLTHPSYFCRIRFHYPRSGRPRRHAPGQSLRPASRTGRGRTDRSGGCRHEAGGTVFCLLQRSQLRGRHGSNTAGSFTAHLRARQAGFLSLLIFWR